MDRKATGIWLFSHKKVQGNFVEWYRDMTELFLRLGHKPTHIVVQFVLYGEIRIVTVARKEKEILQRLSEGEIPTHISLLACPKTKEGMRTEDYVLVAEYKVLGRSKDCILYVVMDNTRCDTRDLDLKEIMGILEKYTELDYGEIVTCSGPGRIRGIENYVSYKHASVINGKKRVTGSDVEILKIYKGEKYVE